MSKPCCFDYEVVWGISSFMSSQVIIYDQLVYFVYGPQGVVISLMLENNVHFFSTLAQHLEKASSIRRLH
jgi:hypothetical protein